MMPYGMPSDHRFDTSWNSSHWLHDLVRNYGYSISTSRMLARFQDSYLVNYLGKKTNYPFHSSPLPNLFWLSWDITCNTKKDMQIIPSANLEKKKRKQNCPSLCKSYMTQNYWSTGNLNKNYDTYLFVFDNLFRLYFLLYGLLYVSSNLFVSFGYPS